MLQFIILGQIPGTHLQITFNWLLVCGIIGLVFFEYKRKAHGNSKQPDL